MAARPKNPPPDRRQEILAAALQAFSTKGYEASTNAQIARAAGVTPAALYYYFPSKADLFRAVLTERKSTLGANVDQLADYVMELPPDVAIPAVLQAASTFLSDERTQAILRIILLEGPRNPEVLEIYQRDVVGQLAPLGMRYLQHQIDLGHIKPIDPRLVGLLLFSPLMGAVLLGEILKVDLIQALTKEMVVQQVVEQILPALLQAPKE